jgi:hypothetical protein
LDFGAQSEEPEQFVPADPREPPKPIQLFIRERPHSQERPPTSPQIPGSDAYPGNIRLIFGEYYGDPHTVQRIADLLQVPRSTIYGHLNKTSIGRRPTPTP